MRITALAATSVHNENRRVSAVDRGLRAAAEHQFVRGPMAVAAHHHERRATLPGGFSQQLSRGTTIAAQRDSLSLNAMPLQLARHRRKSFERFFRGLLYGHHDHALRLGKKRQRDRQCTGSIGGLLPANHYRAKQRPGGVLRSN